MALQLLVTDRNLNVVGDPLPKWTKLACDLNWNRPASGEVQLPAWPEVMELLQPGHRLVVVRDKQVWCAGPMEEPQDYAWDLGANAGGTVTVRFSDDLARVAGYLTYPEPTKTFTAQDTVTDRLRTFTSTNNETIIRQLVDENCGPGALAARRIEQLVLDDVAGVGSNRSLSTRFAPLLDACREAAAPDGLGFRTRQVGKQIRFGVYAPRDLTGTARFSAGLGNLRSLRFTLGAPRATAELVQGGGDPDDTATPPNVRVYVEVDSGAAADWYRVEKLIDKTGTDDDSGGELTQAGTLALGDDNPQASLSTVTVDTEDLRAGRDYFLGDKVTVALPTGLEVADIVQTIRLEATPDEGELVTSVIGNSDKTTTTATVRTVRDLARRLGRLEVR
ncbi:siphovirus ReqiPepy6 Gp37-like family protein [Streptomyces albogriseolus]|uniref:siphovirus ReqiPepy6 Gp37-like family protein n=1 Tax=Streptomyces albogriseolus TaxID=1887 RepID=UPI002252FB8F|nr:siphovirus ReqiPepy6 Gp37-like family protein [Streptomyces viridodiastaticus]MCX4622777.1 siphovirus ReqiPepy6 Gp37-like family protein [Streptomyces viridodiastaticus]